MLTGAIEEIDEVFKENTYDLITRLGRQTYESWADVKFALQHFAIEYMDEEQAYMYSRYI